MWGLEAPHQKPGYLKFGLAIEGTKGARLRLWLGPSSGSRATPPLG
jgi:hypothetical protein